MIPEGMSFAQVSSSSEISYAYDPKTLQYARNKYNRAGEQQTRASSKTQEIQTKLDKITQTTQTVSQHKNAFLGEHSNGLKAVEDAKIGRGSLEELER